MRCSIILERKDAWEAGLGRERVALIKSLITRDRKRCTWGAVAKSSWKCQLMKCWRLKTLFNIKITSLKELISLFRKKHSQTNLKLAAMLPTLRNTDFYRNSSSSWIFIRTIRLIWLFKTISFVRFFPEFGKKLWMLPLKKKSLVEINMYNS